MKRLRPCIVLTAGVSLLVACGSAGTSVTEVGAPIPESRMAISESTGSAHHHGGDAAKGDTPTSTSEVPAPTTSVPTTPVPTTPVPTTTTVLPPLDLYAHTRAGMLAPQVADVTPRVYVPNSGGGTVTVIDPATLDVLENYPVGVMPHHVTPSWDLSTLYALDTAGNALIPIDPRNGRPGKAIRVEDPYNLYFTPDGTSALVVAERYSRIDLRDPHTWELQASIPIAHPGVNHGDFSPDGRYFYASCEFSGWVVKVDLVEREVVVEAPAGVEPIDVKLSPDASVVYVADQARNGVMLLDPGDLHEIGFLATGRGSHGLYPSRDGRSLYVTNRLAGSVSVVDFASRAIVATWTIPGGGSPDMGSVSPDGTQLWLAGRYHGEVYVFDTASGTLITRIKVGPGAHGLTYFPQPGRYSLGHTGHFR